MTRRDVHTTTFVSLSALCFLGGGIFGCGSEPPAAVRLGEPILIGTYTLTVQRVQPAPIPGPPISSFREQPGRKGILVFAQWSGLDGLDPMSRIEFAQEYLEDRLSITDSDNKRHQPTSALQTALLSMSDPGGNWRDWIVLYHVPEESGGWILEVENPEPAEGQPPRFAVDLGS